MLSKKEVRIGNLILYNGQPVYVSAELLVNWKDEDAAGIALTEGQLQVVGFDRVEPQPGILQYRWKGGEMTGEVDKDGIWAFNPGVGTYWIEKQYLHELQNLIYALCGEELTIKP